MSDRERLDELHRALRAAVAEADWSRAAEIVQRRDRFVRSLFEADDKPAPTTLRGMAEEIAAVDDNLSSEIHEARDRVIAALRDMRRGNRVAEGYRSAGDDARTG